MPKLKHFDNADSARFVTFTCYHRYQLLTAEPVIRTFLEQLHSLREKHSLRILGYVVMPDHVHIVLYPSRELKLGHVIGELKSRSAREILSMHADYLVPNLDALVVHRDGKMRHVFWQRRCYDRNCRSASDVLEKINYCHMNPVRSGLVANEAEWLWSSFGWYAGGKEVPLEMDNFL
jgi:putative transposase